MNREYHRWYSPRLGRDMELLVFGHQGEPVILFPSSFGRFWLNEDMGMIGAIGEKIRAGRYMVFCVDNVDTESWANRNAHPHDRVLRHEQYESYIVEEVVPFARSRASPGRLTAAGPSFGGFLAGIIGLRHPWTFERVLTLSAIFETERWLDGYHDLRVYFHSPLQWVSNLHDPVFIQQAQRQEIILAIAEHDHHPCIDSTSRLSEKLWAKGIGNHLTSWNGYHHDWPVWRLQFNHYLPW
ncbi:MAG: esterase family protein [Myxococcaceae bacterium]|nr:esterase family protein [Myxococcaceae bacterium]